MTGSTLYTFAPQQTANHYFKDCDENGYVLCGKFDTATTPDTTANTFQVGCQMTKTDYVNSSNHSAIFVNIGTLSAPVWSQLIHA